MVKNKILAVVLPLMLLFGTCIPIYSQETDDFPRLVNGLYEYETQDHNYFYFESLEDLNNYIEYENQPTHTYATTVQNDLIKQTTFFNKWIHDERPAFQTTSSYQITSGYSCSKDVGFTYEGLQFSTSFSHSESVGFTVSANSSTPSMLSVYAYKFVASKYKATLLDNGIAQSSWYFAIYSVPNGYYYSARY